MLSMEFDILKIKLPPNHVQFISKKSQLEFVEKIFNQALIIGIDTETKPQRRKNMPQNPVALLQIACRNREGIEHVFVLDLLVLNPLDYNSMLCKLFLSPSVLKLGQGLFSDLKELSASYSQVKCFHVMKYVVEVNDLSRHLNGDHQMISLRKLTMKYLQKRLSKAQQVSNWSRRPLTKGQLHYAALDALVLLYIHDEMVKQISLKIKLPTAACVVDDGDNTAQNITPSAISSFNTRLVSQVLDVNLKKTYPCLVCNEKEFSDMEGLRCHKAACGNGTFIHCAYCMKRFKTPSALKMHSENSGSCSEIKVNNLIDTSNPNSICQKNSLRVTKGFYKQCGFCEKTFRSVIGFNEHRIGTPCSSMRVFAKLQKDFRYRWECPKCKKVFPQPQKLSIHLNLCGKINKKRLFGTDSDENSEPESKKIRLNAESKSVADDLIPTPVEDEEEMWSKFQEATSSSYHEDSQDWDQVKS